MKTEQQALEDTQVTSSETVIFVPPGSDDQVRRVALHATQAFKFSVYHDIVDQLCLSDGFRLILQEDGTCPKFISKDTQYLYSAERYFIKDAKIYHCTLSLELLGDEPIAYLLTYFDENGEVHEGKTRRGILQSIIETEYADKSDMFSMVSYIFRDGVMQLDCDSCMWGSWGDTGETDSAHPEDMMFNVSVLADMVRADGAVGCTNIRQASVVSVSGYGRNAMLSIAFMSDEGLAQHPVSLADYIAQNIASKSFENWKASQNDAHHPITPWAHMYGGSSAWEEIAVGHS